MNKVIEYTEDSNILTIHKSILDYYAHLTKYKLPEWLKEKDRLVKLLDNKLDKVSIKSIREKIDIIDQINELLSDDFGNKLVKDYEDNVIEILKEYEKLHKGIRKVFGKPPIMTEEQRILRSELIDKFVTVVSKYTDVFMVRLVEHDYEQCPNCGNDRELVDGIKLVCSECNIGDIQITKECYQSSSRRKENVSSNSYYDRENFIKEITKMQAKQNKSTNILTNIFSMLDDYFSARALTSAEEIRNMEMIGRRRGKYNKSEMREALSSNKKLRDYYKEIDLILKLYWGWEPITLTDVQYAQLLKDYDDSQEILCRINEGVRSSCINIEYRKFRHLKKLGIPCVKDDFHIVSTTDILNGYEEMWKQVCNELGWEFVPISSYD